MQGAIGRVQLKHMSEWTQLRNRNASILTNAFKQFTDKNGLLRIPQLKSDNKCVHAYYKYYVFVERKSLKDKWDREEISEINSQGVPCFMAHVRVI